MVFAFEGDPSLEWIPLDVRRKLDLAGVRLSLAAWQALPFDEKVALRDAIVASEAEALSFGREVLILAERIGRPASKMEPVPFDDRPWQRAAAAGAVEERCRTLGIAVDIARWSKLDDAARYALHRLADPKKSEEKLRAAVEELGLALREGPRG